MPTHWQEMEAYVGYSMADAERLHALLPVVEPRLAVIADHFYEVIWRFPNARDVFVDQAQVERQKGFLVQWVRELLTGPHDGAYWSKREAIGRTHVRVGLPARFMFTAMNVLRSDLVAAAREGLPRDVADAVVESLVRVVDIELAVMSGTYMEAHEARELGALQELIIRNMPVTILCLDAHGIVTAATRPSTRLFSSTEVSSGAHYERLVPAELVEKADLAQHIARAVASDNEIILPRVTLGERPSQRHFRVSVVPLHHELATTLLHIEELTDTVQAVERAEHHESLARIGSLAANVAHEIRNPLTSISATLQVIGGSMEDRDRRKPILDKVQEQVRRLDRLVTDLLGYARRVQPHMVEVDLAHVVRDAIQASGVPVELREVAHAPVRADVQFVQQVLVNLVQNARDACGPGIGIRVILDGGRIVVADDGPGIPDDVATHVFEPFFTTKAKGTGLGLAICQKLVHSMGGRLLLNAPGDRTAGTGAVFTIELSEAHASPRPTIAPRVDA